LACIYWISTSKKQKVSAALLDQSIEQLNDVTAVSGVNLRVLYFAINIYMVIKYLLTIAMAELISGAHT